MARRRRRNPYIGVGEVLVWFFFFALLVPAGVVGWAIGHNTAGGTRTVTVAASSSPATTSAAATTTAAATSTKAATTAASTTTAATSSGGNAAKGKTVFTASGCGSCHTYKPAGATATIGPDLDTKPEADAKKANMQLTAFLHESIVKPDAYISPGYQKGLMPGTFGTQLSATQLADLVAFLSPGA